MLNDIYLHAQLARAARRARPGDEHLAMIAQLRRRRSPARRLARLLGRGLFNLAEGLLAYGADRPLRRLSLPVGPLVELHPGPTPHSQN